MDADDRPYKAKNQTREALLEILNVAQAGGMLDPDVWYPTRVIHTLSSEDQEPLTTRVSPSGATDPPIHASNFRSLNMPSKSRRDSIEFPDREFPRGYALHSHATFPLGNTMAIRTLPPAGIGHIVRTTRKGQHLRQDHTHPRPSNAGEISRVPRGRRRVVANFPWLAKSGGHGPEATASDSPT